jgi:aminoglycoside phosphotransferase (APT) family kinase protein
VRDILSKTAAGLAALHSCGVVHGPTSTWDDEVRDVRRDVEAIAAVMGEIEEPALHVLDAVIERARRQVPQQLQPSHHDFRASQVLLAGNRVGFIDFDDFRMAEPALDIAHFRVKLAQTAMSVLVPSGDDLAPLDAPEFTIVDELCELFVRSYQRHDAVARERVAAYEGLYLLTCVLHAWSRAKPRRLLNCIGLLHRNLIGSVATD